MVTPIAGFGTLSPNDLIFQSETLSADVLGAIEDVQLIRSINGASTINVITDDPIPRNLLNAGIFYLESVLSLDGLNFVLVEITKQASEVTYVFESQAVFNLRQQSGNINAQTSQSVIPFVQSLVQAIGLNFVAGGGITPQPVTLGRGTSSDPNEDSWTAMSRIASDAGFRAFEVNNTIYFATDPFLINTQPLAATLQEGTAKVQNIDFDFDIGKPLGTGEITCTCNDWVAEPGQPVELVNLGLANGKWLVSDCTRSLFNPTTAVIKIQQPQTPLQITNPDESQTGISQA